MRQVTVLRAADARRVPWRNGRGATLELAVRPAGASLARDDFDWRVSAAAVDEDGPFSPFPGCERVLVVTRGAGLWLAVGAGGRPALLRRLEPFRFPGDEPARAELVAGPVADFNVVARRGRARADVQALRLGARRVLEGLDADHVVAHVLAGAALARVTGEEQPFELAAGDTLLADEPADGDELELAGLVPETEVLLARIADA